MLRSLTTLRQRFGLDRRGVAAVEFALIAPILILIYFGVGELCEAMMAQRRTAHATSAVGDLATQSTTLAASDVSDIFSAASTILQPFPTTTLKLRLTSVTVNSSKNPAIDWSCVNSAWGSNTNKAGNTYNGLPAGLLATDANGNYVVGDSVVVAEGGYSWANPVNISALQVNSSNTIQGFMPSSIPFNEIFYLKPRKSSQVVWTGASC